METRNYIFTTELDTELKYSFARSSGPGGQNVNKVNTKVELRFDIHNSRILCNENKEILLNKLATQLTSDGILIVVSQATRSQLKNKENARFKFYEIINEGLKPRKQRKRIKISMAAQEKRLKDKKQTSEKKERRKSFDES